MNPISNFLARAARALAPLLTLALAILLAAPAAAQTLAAVRERGFLICAAVSPSAGFAQLDAEGRWSGFDVDLCRAIAAATLGNPDLLEFRPLRGESRFAHLQNREIDVIVRNAPWTQRRDTTFEARYVVTTFHDGQAFMVPNGLGIVSAFELDGQTICVAAGGDAPGRLRDFFFRNQADYRAILYEDAADLLIAYRAGRCNVVSGTGRDLHAIRRDLPDPMSHRILPERISKDAIGPVVRQSDEVWFDIVRWTIYALVNAEEYGLTAFNIESLSATRTPAVRRILGLERDFGADLGLSATFMADVIRAVGNYGEIYDRNFGPQTGPPLPRGQNSLWINGGLLYAPPIR